MFLATTGLCRLKKPALALFLLLATGHIQLTGSGFDHRLSTSARQWTIRLSLLTYYDCQLRRGEKTVSNAGGVQELQNMCVCTLATTVIANCCIMDAVRSEKVKVDKQWASLWTVESFFAVSRRLDQRPLAHSFTLLPHNERSCWTRVSCGWQRFSRKTLWMISILGSFFGVLFFPLFFHFCFTSFWVSSFLGGQICAGRFSNEDAYLSLSLARVFFCALRIDLLSPNNLLWPETCPRWPNTVTADHCLLWSLKLEVE